MNRGQFVRITLGTQSVDGMVLLASDNGRSLMLGFDGLLHIEGGMYAGGMPVLMDDAGTYRDLRGNEAVRVEVRE